MDSKRIQWIDFARCFAIICVVLTHAAESIYKLTQETMEPLRNISMVFGVTSFTLGRLGVPVFLMISGYLLLPKKYDVNASYKFWKNNWLGLVITTEIWIVIYRLFLAAYDGIPLQFGMYIRNALFLENVTLSHMWYMPMIIGTYLFVPFVANAVNSMNFKVLKFPLVLLFVYLFLVPMINVLYQAIGKDNVTSVLTLQFSGGIYGLMLIAGYLIQKNILKKLKSGFLIASCITMFCATVLLQIFTYFMDSYYKVWYDWGTLFLTSLMLFELFSRMKKIPCEKLIKNLAKCSFGIYLVHNLILLIVRRYGFLPGNTPIQMLLLFAVSFLGSWIFVAALGRIPKLGKVLFFMKA